MFTKTALFIYFALVLLLGIYSYYKIKNNGDFFIAGKEAGVLQVTGSLLASILGSSAIIGSVDFAYAKGWAGASMMVCGAFGLGVLYFLTPYFKDFKGYNLPNLLGNFYGQEVEKLSSLVISMAWLGIVASQIIGAAKIITILTDFSYSEGVILSGCVFIAYTILGGQLSILKTDFVQFLFIAVGLALCFFFVKAEGVAIQGAGFINEKFTLLDLIVMLFTYSTTFFVGPDIYSRLFCAKTEKTMKTSILLSIAVLLPLAFILASLGNYGAAVFTPEMLGKESVLLMIARDKLPAGLSYLVYFGLLSAVISSADTTLLTGSSLLTQVFVGNLKEKKAIAWTRVLSLVLGIVSIFIALHMTYILKPLFMALAVYSGSFIIPVLAGIFSYRGSKTRVLLAILVGGLTAFAGKLIGGMAGNFVAIFAFVINAAILFVGHKKA